MSQAKDTAAPVHAIAAEFGLGKTDRVLGRLAKHDLMAKRYHYYIPQHRLAEEVEARFIEIVGAGAATHARIFRGRNRTLPDGEPMCHDALRPRADAFQKRTGLALGKNFCEPVCPHNGQCGWTRQRADDAPGLVILPQHYAFDRHVAKLADWQIFDESFWAASLRHQSVAVSSLGQRPSVPRRKGYGEDFLATTDLWEARMKLSAAMKEAGAHGVPSNPQLAAARMTTDIAARAKGAEHQRADSVAAHITAGMSVANIESAWTKFQHQDARRWATFWRMVEGQIDLPRERLHGVRRRQKQGDHGDVVDVLEMTWSADLQTNIPTLLLDATLNKSIARRFFPSIDKVNRTPIKIPDSVHIRQITDRPVSKAMIAPPGDDGGDAEPIAEQRRQQNNATRLLHIVEREALGAHMVGLFTYQQTEAALKERLPVNVSPGHFNGVRGLDGWKNCDRLIVAGRTQPSETDVEWLAEGLFWRAEQQISTGSYGTTTRHYSLPDGVVPNDRAVAHPDPLVEAVRWQVTEAELLQVIGRARLIRRDGRSPCKVLLLTNVPLPIPVDELTEWPAEVPDRFELMMIRGMLLNSRNDMTVCYPDLFPTAESARMAQKAHTNISGRWGSFPYKDNIIGKRPPPRPSQTLPGRQPPLLIRYHPAGKGQRPRHAWWDRQTIPDHREWLEQRLGPLTQLAVVEEDQTAVIDAALAAWESGTAPSEVSQAFRVAYQEQGLSQRLAASVLGISRPHLANILAGRFGASPSVVANMKAFLSDPPLAAMLAQPMRLFLAYTLQGVAAGFSPVHAGQVAAAMVASCAH